MEESKDKQVTTWKIMEEHLNKEAIAKGHGNITKSSSSNEMDDKLFTTNAIVKTQIKIVMDLSNKKELTGGSQCTY